MEKAIIVGAGIGGLCTALCLAKKGISSTILEKSQTPRAEGAGIQISPNAAKVLLMLGLEEDLKSVGVQPNVLAMCTSQSTKPIAKLPLREKAQSRFGAPYFVIHRNDLQSAFLKQVEANPDITIQWGMRLQSVDQRPDGIEAHATEVDEPRSFVADIFVGSDGLWSETRRILGDPTKPRFQGYRAWRALVERKDAEDVMDCEAVTATMGPNAHMVYYPICGGDKVNIVAITRDPNPSGEWNDQTYPTPPATAFAGWRTTDPLRKRVRKWQSWPIFDRPSSSFWGRGRTILLGDAAHPMLPFFAQGGAMAIEDAAVLAACLDQKRDDPITALKDYANIRRDRTAMVQQIGHQNGRIFHLPTPMAIARDTYLRAMPADRLLDRYQKVYGWNPPTL